MSGVKDFRTEIEEKIDAISTDPDLRSLLSLSLGRVLVNMATRGEDWRQAADEDTVRHIGDWLKVALADNAPWLSKRDADGRPKKLMKFSTVEGIVAEADKAMLLFAEKNGNLKLEPGEEEVWLELEGGYVLVRLLTPTALDRESASMQHCIGQGGYDRNLLEGICKYVSLRDAYGKPHATAEIGPDGCIIQLQGKQNAIPARRYVEIMRPAFLRSDFNPGNVLARLGLVLSADGEFLDKRAIPAGTTVIGDLRYEGKSEHTISLPDDLTVRGTLRIKGYKKIALPRGLCVEGDLDIGTSVFVVPYKVDLWKNVAIHATEIYLPDGFSAGGNLDINCEEIRRFPRGLTVGGVLTVQGATFSLLPSDLKVGGAQLYGKCEIGEVEPGFVSSASLSMDSCNIASLPEGLEVKGDFSLAMSAVAALPEVVNVSGNLVIVFATLDRLPAGWQVGGGIEAGGSSISSVSGRTHVNGDLNLAATNVSDLDCLTNVAGGLHIYDTHISKLPADLTVSGDIDAKRSSLASLPEDLNVHGRLIISETKVSTIPSNLVVSGSVDLMGTPITAIPRGFSCAGYLDIIGTQVKSIPDGCRFDRLMCDDGLEHVGEGVIVTKGILMPELSEILTVNDLRARLSARHQAAA